jgi:CBS domain-containing protein
VAEPTARVLMNPVPSVDPAMDVASALRLMVAHRVHHLPVVEQRHCVGLLSETDFAKATGPFDLVGLVCRRPVPTVEPGADRGRILSEMHRHGADALGVLDGMHLMGLVTATDLVRSEGRESW